MLWGCVGLGLALTLGCQRSREMQVRRLDPVRGAMQGAQQVKVIGRNFQSDLGYTVYFGNKRADSVTIVDRNTLMVEAPSADKAGPVDVTVRADNGIAYRIRRGFTYADMSGSVVEKLGEDSTQAQKRGNLAY
ncbi:MAG: IPT/TIG domain-containing protein [Polyangiales bacterium]